MEDLEGFLRQRGVSQDKIEEMKADKIDKQVIAIMPDEDLKKYIPSYGDRISVVAFCKASASRADNSEAVIGNTVTARLQERLKRRRPSDLTPVQRKGRLSKPSRRIELGWMNFDQHSQSYKQVRSRNGGGTRHLIVERHLTMGDILNLGKQIFFPDGCSQKGRVEFFDAEIKDFQLRPVRESMTIAEMYEECRMKTLHLYLYTKKNNSEEITIIDTDSGEELPPGLPGLDRPAFARTTTGTTTETVTPDVRTETTADLDTELPDLDSGTPTIQFHRRHLTLDRGQIQDIDTLPFDEEEIKEKTCGSLLEELSVLGSKTETHKNLINVDREDVLDGAFRAFSRASFKLWGSLDVKFVDEDGIDQGGPMREFMRLAVAAVQQLPIFEGPTNERMLALDYNSLQKKRYFFAGQLLAYCVIHRGPLPTFFSPLLYTILSEGEEDTQATVNDILDTSLQSLVRLIQEATSKEEFKRAVSEAEEVISLAGCFNLTISYTKEMQANLVTALCRFLVVDRVRGPIKQFAEGLNSMGLLTRIKANRMVWRNAFVGSESVLDAQQMVALFSTQWSEHGSNRVRQERRITVYWRDLLQDLEEGLTGPLTDRNMGLKDALVFVTGADSIPPLGFDPSPTISFIHPDQVEEHHMKGMPVVNTCAMLLRLPVVDTFEEFKANMTSAMDVVTTFTTQ